MLIIVIVIATALALDSFSVAIANGLATKIFKTPQALKISAFFGFFQAVMPILGWYSGKYILELISEFDHWIAFSLLALIGSRMIYETIKPETKSIIKKLSNKILLILSIATSIDALAVGLSLIVLDISIMMLAVVTGGITFTLSFCGVYIGGRFGRILQKKVEALGGIILITIGLRIVLEHLEII